MGKGFSYREGMGKLLEIALAEVKEPKAMENLKRDMEAFCRVTKALCSKAKRADKKALKALSYLKETGALSEIEYQEKIKAISGLDDDVIRATQWPRGVLEVVASVLQEALDTQEAKKKPKETKAA